MSIPFFFLHTSHLTHHDWVWWDLSWIQPEQCSSSTRSVSGLQIFLHAHEWPSTNIHFCGCCQLLPTFWRQAQMWGLMGLTNTAGGFCSIRSGLSHVRVKDGNWTKTQTDADAHATESPPNRHTGSLPNKSCAFTFWLTPKDTFCIHVEFCYSFNCFINKLLSFCYHFWSAQGLKQLN